MFIVCAFLLFSCVVCVQSWSLMVSVCSCWFFFFFFKQKTAYEMRISDWSSDVCSSDLLLGRIDRKWDTRDEIRVLIGQRIPVLKRRAQLTNELQIGRASCRERVCQYV